MVMGLQYENGGGRGESYRARLGQVVSDGRWECSRVIRVQSGA